MGLLDVIFGRTRLSRSKLESLFDMSTAYVTLTTKGDLEVAGRAGICFRSVESSFYTAAERELDRIIQFSGRASSTKIDTTKDNYGFTWVVFEDPDFEDLVAAVHITGQTLAEKGFRDQLLAAVFKFRTVQEGQTVYWIYNYKRGSFYPFVPTESGQQRNNAMEVRLASLMEKELPIEKQLEQWYALWGIPV